MYDEKTRRLLEYLKFYTPDCIKWLHEVDDDLKKYIFENYKFYNLTKSNVVYLLSLIKDDEYKYNVFKNKENYEFEPSNYLNVAKTFNDDTYKKEIIESGFFDNESLTIVLISSLKDNKYKENYILNFERERFYNPDDELIMIISSMDKDYQKRVIENYSNYNLTPYVLLRVLLLMNDNEYVNKEIDKLYKNGVFGNTEIVKYMELPSDMTIGIEIEFKGLECRNITGPDLAKRWDCRYDSSVLDGKELISPIIRSNNNDEYDIYKICNILTTYKQRVDECCGGHIHIGADYFDDIDCYKNLLEIYLNTEKVLYLISNAKGDPPRGGVTENALPLSRKTYNKMLRDKFDINNANSIEEFLKTIKKIEPTRFYGLNFHNLKKENKNTIEFRIPNSSLNPKVWIENINLYGNIIRVTKEITELSKKKNLNTIEKSKLELFDYLKSEDLTEETKLEILLFLALEKENRDIYRDRYYTNRELTSGIEAEALLENDIEHKSIKLVKKKKA